MALQTLQIATEDYLVDLFEDSYSCALFANRTTLMISDLALVMRIRGVKDPGGKD